MKVRTADVVGHLLYDEGGVLKRVRAERLFLESIGIEIDAYTDGYFTGNVMFVYQLYNVKFLEGARSMIWKILLPGRSVAVLVRNTEGVR